MPRHCYVLELSRARPALPAPRSLAARAPVPADHEALAVLMDDAYRGTIDHNGETLDDAREEVARFYTDHPLLDCSRLGEVDGQVVSACLMSAGGTIPFIAYAMTAAAHKKRGLATYLIGTGLGALEEAGHAQARAWITEGNQASEAVFARLGFVRM